MKMKFLFSFSVLALLIAFAEGSDAGCESQGGTCQDDSLHCGGTYHSNLCSGASSRRCCVSACASRGGHCQDDHGTCSGSYYSGLCSGGTHNRCCVPGGGSTSTGSGSCPSIVSRAQWGARAPKHSIGHMSGPARYVFIHHGSSSPCYTPSACVSKIKSYQDYHMDGHGWTDIGYNFVVGEDGRAYEARGWTEIGAHTQGYNSVGIAICVIGDFNDRVPNAAALQTIKDLIQCGLNSGHISASYTLKGHRDVGSTDCPGQKLYDLIHSWPHYASGKTLYG